MKDRVALRVLLVLPVKGLGRSGHIQQASTWLCSCCCRQDFGSYKCETLVETRTAEEGWDPSDKVGYKHLCQQMDLGTEAVN